MSDYHVDMVPRHQYIFQHEMLVRFHEIFSMNSIDVGLSDSCTFIWLFFYFIVNTELNKIFFGTLASEKSTKYERKPSLTSFSSSIQSSWHKKTRILLALIEWRNNQDQREKSSHEDECPGSVPHLVFTWWPPTPCHICCRRWKRFPFFFVLWEHVIFE